MYNKISIPWNIKIYIYIYQIYKTFIKIIKTFIKILINKIDKKDNKVNQTLELFLECVNAEQID